MISIHRLTNSDIPRVLSYIEAKREYNLFIEGDIEQYGLQSDIVTMYALGDDWDSLVLRFYNNFIVTTNKSRCDIASMADFLQQQSILCLSGEESLLMQLVPYFPTAKFQGTYLCRLDKRNHTPVEGRESEVVRLHGSDAKAVVELYKLIDEFARPYLEHEETKLQETASNLDGAGLAFGMFAHDKLVCVANTTARSKSGAMVIGVATHPDYRGRGYASTVMNKLCSESFSQGLQFLCLFYDNPKAGAIYHRLGFETVGRWAMMRF